MSDDDREAICGSLGLHPETGTDELLATIAAVRSEARNYPALQLRIGELAEQVKTLRAALQASRYELTTLLPRLTAEYRPNVQATVDMARAALAATAPPGESR